MKKYVFIFVFAMAGALLAGCHPCMFSQCGSWVRTEAFIGNDGEVYIDIPDRNKYKSAKLHSISISVRKNNKSSVYYWASTKSLNSEITQIGKGNDFPIKYGVDAPGATSDTPPKKLENGKYAVRGVVFLTNMERDTYDMAGEFIYKDGAIQNVK